MSVSWEFRGELLVVTEVGVSTNEELGRAFAHEALTDPRARPGLSVLWDARASETPVSADDLAWRGDELRQIFDRRRVARIALLLRPDQSLTAALGQRVVELPRSAFAIFTDETAATAWLTSP